LDVGSCFFIYKKGEKRNKKRREKKESNLSGNKQIAKHGITNNESATHYARATGQQPV